MSVLSCVAQSSIRFFTPVTFSTTWETSVADSVVSSVSRENPPEWMPI